MLNLLIFLFTFGILVIVHEFGHFIAAKKAGVRIEKFSLGFGPELLSRKKGDTEYSLSLIPVGGYVKLAGDNLQEHTGGADEYLSRKPGERAGIIFCGPLLNYVLGFICFWVIFFSGYPAFTTKVGTVLEGLGAQGAGIQPGDQIISVDNQRVSDWDKLQQIIQDKKEDTLVKITLLRNGQELTKEVEIKEKELNGPLNQKRRIGLIGITPAGDEIIKIRHGFMESFFLAANKTLELTVMTYKGIWWLVSGRMSLGESMTGPLGIFYITSRAARAGVAVFLHLIAVLNVSLAIFNLLPFPILDGGHILLLAIEKIRGKYISPKTEQILTKVGLAAIILLAVVVTYNDLMRFFGDKLAGLIK